MRTNEDEIMPCTEEEVAEEEEKEEDEGDANGEDPTRITAIQATGKRSLRHGFSKFIASKRRKKRKKKIDDDDDGRDSEVPSRHQFSCCLMPLCYSRPPDLPPDSPLSRPALQSLIEKNDFFSAQCNVHRNLSFHTQSN